MFDCQHIMIAASNVDEAKEFYAGKLGLPIIEEHPGMFAVRAGGVRFTVFGGGRKLPEETEDWAAATLLLSTPDLDAAMAELKEKGVTFAGAVEEAPGFMKHIALTDPDNNILFIGQYYRNPVEAAPVKEQTD